MGGFLCLSAAARRSPRISRIAPTALQASHRVQRRPLAWIRVRHLTPRRSLTTTGSRCQRRENQGLAAIAAEIRPCAPSKDSQQANEQTHE